MPDITYNESYETRFLQELVNALEHEFNFVLTNTRIGLIKDLQSRLDKLYGTYIIRVSSDIGLQIKPIYSRFQNLLAGNPSFEEISSRCKESLKNIDGLESICSEIYYSAGYKDYFDESAFKEFFS